MKILKKRGVFPNGSHTAFLMITKELNRLRTLPSCQ